MLQVIAQGTYNGGIKAAGVASIIDQHLGGKILAEELACLPDAIRRSGDQEIRQLLKL